MAVRADDRERSKNALEQHEKVRRQTGDIVPGGGEASGDTLASWLRLHREPCYDADSFGAALAVLGAIRAMRDER